ncbi:hypothetical protein Dimus_011239, partial [Dionaea muscipula]
EENSVDGQRVPVTLSWDSTFPELGEEKHEAETDTAHAEGGSGLADEATSDGAISGGVSAASFPDLSPPADISAVAIGDPSAASSSNSAAVPAAFFDDSTPSQARMRSLQEL